MNTLNYRLSDAWVAYCHALKVPVSAVQALAGQGRILAAFHRLQRRLADLGTGATTVARPLSHPFELLGVIGTSGPAAGQQPALQDVAAGAPALSAPSGETTAERAAAATAPAPRGAPASPAKKVRRFRPLVRSRLLVAASVRAPRLSVQIFVWNPVLGGPSNAAT